MTMPSFTTTPGRAAAVVLGALLVVAGGCSDSFAPLVDGGGGAISIYQPPPAMSLYSVQSSGSFSGMSVSANEEAVGGERWCQPDRVWFDPAATLCRGQGQAPPYGQVVEEEGELVLVSEGSRAMAFLWTGPPGRVNPFPEAGDFTLDLRLKADNLRVYGAGVYILPWNPAGPEGASTPFAETVLQIWADTRLLQVSLLGNPVAVKNATAEHFYHLAYEEGAYTLYVDGQQVAGPIASDVRPTAAWIGNPSFVSSAVNWTTLRLAQFNISTPAADEVAVSLDIKPGGCPTPVNLRARGILPVAIAGTAELDVSQIDGSTLRLEGVPVTRYAVEDVTTPVEPYVGRTAEDCSTAGSDGMADLTAKFPMQELALVLADGGDAEGRALTLTGNLLPEFGGTPIIGEDWVVIRRW